MFAIISTPLFLTRVYVDFSVDFIIYVGFNLIVTLAVGLFVYLSVNYITSFGCRLVLNLWCSLGRANGKERRCYLVKVNCLHFFWS